jgi:N-formylglutamate deformylase
MTSKEQLTLKTFEFAKGSIPILVSMPHNGIALPPEMTAKMTSSALKLVDTDWYMDKIYAFASEMGCSVINPIYSRYVIDLNRPEDDVSLYPGADVTELCPTTQFDKQPIYIKGQQPDQCEVEKRVETYWRPYHQKLSETLKQMKLQHGFVLLFEAHSIKSIVPRFFEGQLPDFNFGNYNLQSSSNELTTVIENWQSQAYTKVINGRFKGGYITRHYGAPENNIDSLQLELSQATYMNETLLQYNAAKATEVIDVLKDLFLKLHEYCSNRVKNG